MKQLGILWDMDGTLIDSEPLHEQTLLRALAQEQIPAPANLHALMLGRSSAWVHAYFAEHLGLRMSVAQWSRLRHQHYLEQAPQLQARAGAVEVFRDLQAAGMRQAIVSNAGRLMVEANLRAIGLAEPDLCSISRNDVRLGKPDPEPYLRAAWLLGVDAAQIRVVEDSVTGALAGLNAGFRTLFWPQTPAEPPLGAVHVQDIAQLRAEVGLPAR